MKRSKWFPWLECVFFVACVPFVWETAEFSRSHLPLEDIIRYQTRPLVIISALLALYVVIRLAFIRPWLAWLYPLLFYGFGTVLGTLARMINRFFSN